MKSDLGRADLGILFSELVRLETELWNAVEGRVRTGHGVTLGSYEVMSVVARQPGCRVQDIAGALSITVGGVSKIIDRIEAAGYCTRRANPADRRSSVIELSPSGGRLLTELTSTVEAMMGGMGRTFDGGHADYTCVPAAPVIAFRSDLDWATLGAVPEMLQTAYGSLTTGLDGQPGQSLLIRGGTSSVGMATAVLAHQRKMTVLATTRNPAIAPRSLPSGPPAVA